MDKIIILDFGSQYTQLIARRVRECGVYSEILPFNVDLDNIRRAHPKGIILSGGPASVFERGAPICNIGIFSLNIPILGICYGLQLIAFLLGGKVETGASQEYGSTILRVIKKFPIFDGIKGEIRVWMSHGDRLIMPPPGFDILAKSPSSPIAAIGNKKKNIYGLQFHPEVVHTEGGKNIIKNFLKICNCKFDWSMGSFIEWILPKLQREIRGQKVICALSGGVDSAVTAMLLHRAIGNRLYTIFIDNGLLRAGEPEAVIDLFKRKFQFNFHHINASRIFLSRLTGIVDPEEKRKIIGNLFIEILEKEAKKIGDIKFLAQGTLYPDVIESVSFKGPSATIKSHHNVGGLPEQLPFKLIEPLRELFKDEVRKLAKELGLPESIVKRQPFPGPGLAIRIIGEVTEERLRVLRKAERIVTEEIERAGLLDKVWQAFPVLIPIKTVGVMGDRRTYEHVIALRVVESVDGMTADFSRLPYKVLAAISNRITGEIRGINRVVYDITSKPPGTIEWE